MTRALREIPPLGRWTLGLHLAWGLFLLLGFAWLGEGAAAAKPLLVASWFGTTAMFLVFGLVVAAEGWRPRETRYLAVLLMFDLAQVAIVGEVLRVG